MYRKQDIIMQLAWQAVVPPHPTMQRHTQQCLHEWARHSSIWWQHASLSQANARTVSNSLFPKPFCIYSEYTYRIQTLFYSDYSPTI
jgi:hypothetical protein